MVPLLMMGATTFASYHFCKKGHNDLLVLFCFAQQPVLTVNKQSPPASQSNAPCSNIADHCPNEILKKTKKNHDLPPKE